jgi:hypothetical protein
VSNYTGAVPDTEPAVTWLKAAACLGLGDEMFPENNVGDIEHARRICAPCPVRKECLAEAMAMEGGRSAKSRFGIRAGLTGGQRRVLYEELRKRKKQAAQHLEAAA